MSRAELANGRGYATTWRQILPAAGLDPEFPCYVVADLRRGTEENASYRNWRRIRQILDDVPALIAVLGATFDEFLSECAAAQVEPIYRIHWDGDIPTPAMAEALAVTVGERAPTLRAWIYTRSMFAAPVLADVPNLVTYLSVDADNVDAARPMLDRYPRLRAAALGVTADDAARVLEQLQRPRAPVCPVDTGRVPVQMDPSRRGEPSSGIAVGACAACRLCIDGLKDVRFTIKKRPFKGRPPLHITKANFDDTTGWEHLFGAPRRAAVANLFNAIDPLLRQLDARVERSWGRLYVSYLLHGQQFVSLVPRGQRLLLTAKAPPELAAGVPGARDISKIGHHAPGFVEYTLTALGQLPVAMRFARAGHRHVSADAVSRTA